MSEVMPTLAIQWQLFVCMPKCSSEEQDLKIGRGDDTFAKAAKSAHCFIETRPVQAIAVHKQRLCAAVPLDSPAAVARAACLAALFL